MNSAFVPVVEIPFATAEVPQLASVREGNYSDDPIYFDFSNEGGVSRIAINADTFAIGESKRQAQFLARVLNQGLIETPAGISFTEIPLNVQILNMAMNRTMNNMTENLSNINEQVTDDYGIDDLDVNGVGQPSRYNEHYNYNKSNALLAQIPFGLITASPTALELEQYVTNVDVLPSPFITTTRANVYRAVTHDQEINKRIVKQSNPLER